MTRDDSWTALRRDLVAWVGIGAESTAFMVGAKNRQWAKQRATFARQVLDRMDELDHGQTLDSVTP